MTNFYKVQTAHGSKIVVDLETGILHHGQPSDGALALVLLWIPSDHPNVCLILSSRNLQIPLSLDREYGEADVISFVLSKEVW